MVQKMYDNGRQWSTTLELQHAIWAAWNIIEVEIFNNLIKSMPKRMKLLFKADGDTIKY